MGPYGATGDTFYWGALKPLLVVLALHGAFQGVAWAPWAFLGLWTTLNVGSRVYLFVQGYRRGLEVVEAVDRLSLLEAARMMKALTALLLGALLAAAVGPERFGAVGGAGFAVWAVCVGSLTFVLVWIMERGVRPVWFAYLFAAVAAGIVAWT
jgi:PTS system mannose-specific IID component